MLSNGQTVMLHVKEKKKWKKYPCCLRDNQFVQYKDSKVCLCNNYLNIISFLFLLSITMSCSS